MAELFCVQSWLLEQLDADAQALAAADDAVALYRSLDNSDDPDFALVLEIQSRLLARQQNFAESTFANDQAIRVYRRIPEKRTALALALVQKAMLAYELRERDMLFVEPIEPTREAVKLLRQEYASRPHAGRADLALALVHQANILIDREFEFDEALETIREAVQLGRESLASEWSIFAHKMLVDWLLDLAHILGQNDMSAEALSASDEALELGRKLVDLDPDTSSTKLLLRALDSASLWNKVEGQVALANKLRREADSLR